MWIEQGRATEIDAENRLVLLYDPLHFGWVSRRYGGWLGERARELGLAGVKLRAVEKARQREELRAVAA
jgi:hypothetical protein